MILVHKLQIFDLVHFLPLWGGSKIPLSDAVKLILLYIICMVYLMLQCQYVIIYKVNMHILSLNLFCLPNSIKIAMLLLETFLMSTKYQIECCNTHYSTIPDWLVDAMWRLINLNEVFITEKCLRMANNQVAGPHLNKIYYVQHLCEHQIWSLQKWTSKLTIIHMICGKWEWSIILDDNEKKW